MLKFWKFRIKIYGISPLRLLRDENQLVLYWFIKSYDVPLLSLYIYTFFFSDISAPFYIIDEFVKFFLLRAVLQF